MANYSLVVGSKFSPFTYQELLQPAVMATQAHQELENQYSELSTKANEWKEKAREETDPKAYAMYKTYAEDLEKQAELLASQGLTPASRKDLHNLKSRYSSEITPIETAYKRRQELIDEQRKLQAQDSTLIFDNDYSTISLDDLIENPNASYNTLSGEGIAKRTSIMAKEAAKAIINDPVYTPVFNNQYVQQKLNQGFTMDQVIAAAQRDPNAPEALKGIVDNIKQQVGYDNWNTANKAKIDSYINEGLEAAVGSPKIDILQNRNFISQAEREQLTLQKNAQKLAEDKWNYDKLGIKQPDGSWVKVLPNKQIQITDSEGNTTIIDAPKTTGSDEDKTKNNKLYTVNSLKEIKNLGYRPIKVVAKTNGKWRRGREGQDVDETVAGFTGSQVVDNKGNYVYTPDNNAEITVISDVEEIPGFSRDFYSLVEYAKSQGYYYSWDALQKLDLSDTSVSLIDKNTAFGQILEAAKEEGISPSDFTSDKIEIARVRVEDSERSRGGEPYDYVIFRKN